MPEELDLEKRIYSIMLTDSSYKTKRGASVSNNITDVRLLYELNLREYHYIFEQDSSYTIQKTFYRKDSDNTDDISSYEGEISKTLSITFYYDSNGVITQIIMNRAYSM